MRRVVVTGLGMVTPLGCGVDATWQRLLAGESGARRIEKFEVADLPAQIACQIPRGDGSNGTYNPDQWMEPKEQRKVDEFIVYAMCAARQAIEDSGWKPTTHEDQIATGVMIGSGIGGIEGIAETAITLKETRTAPRVAVLHPRPADQSRLRLRVDRVRPEGPEPRGRRPPARPARMRSAMPARLIALGDADVMVAGGTESPVNRLSMAGFAACRALSTAYNDDADQGLAPLRQGSRRLRHGRGRGRRRARGVRARQGARREDLRRSWSATACRATPSTSRRRPRTATARSAA